MFRKSIPVLNEYWNYDINALKNNIMIAQFCLKYKKYSSVITKWVFGQVT